MNDQERLFIDSIEKKIKRYSIKVTLKEVLNNAANKFIETTYSDGTKEIVDWGIEYFLCKKSALYFIEKYAFIDLPGTGIIPFSLYYFQRESLKETPNLKYTVFLKTRQCLTKDNFVMTNKGYVSIKDVRPGDKIETIVDGKSSYTLIEDWMDQGEKEVCKILTKFGAEIICTLDHKIFTKEGWKKAEEITLDDEIVSLFNKGSFGNYELEKDEYADLIGKYLVLGDSSKLKFINIEKPFNKALTNDLMNLNERQMTIMLNRLFTDGGYMLCKKGDDYEIGLGSSNFILLKQVEYILHTKYKISCWIDNLLFDENDFWKLRITQKGSIIAFINKIGINKEINDLLFGEEIGSKDCSFEKVVKIEFLEKKERVYDITTVTSDFVANGLLVHNCGISTLFSLYCFWKGNFYESEFIDVISTKQSKAQKFVNKMDATIKRLPGFLKTPITNKNSHGIKWSNNSEITSEAASDRAGRSDTLSLLILDEAAHYRSDNLTRGIVAAAFPTLGRTGGSSIVISTPNKSTGAGSWYYEQVNELMLRGNSTEEKLITIEWYEVPDLPGIRPYKGYNKVLEKFIEKNYFNKPEVRKEMEKYFAPITKDWRNNEWLKKQHEKLGNILFSQEVLHSFVLGENQVFEENVLEKIRNDVSKYTPIWEDELNGIKVKGLLVWNLPVPKHRYILSCDVGKGTSKDFSSIEVMDVENYEQVAEYKSKITTKNLGRLIKMIAKYYNQAFVVIESNGIGEAVFNEVYFDDNAPYQNIYKQKISKNGITTFTGWSTTEKTRQLMTNNLIDWFAVDELYESMKVKSPRLYQEMLTWVWKGGRPDHESSGNDDLLIAWGLCLFLRNKVSNYGESFFIAEDGKMLQYEEGDEKLDIDKGSFDFTTTEKEDYKSELLEKYGVESEEQLRWLLR